VYNALLLGWPEITRLSRVGRAARGEQGGLFA
jgi:hypothetical protein